MGMYGRFPKVFDDDGILVEQRADPVVDCSKDKPMTVQSDRDTADINRIVKLIASGGQPGINQRPPFYGDVSELGGLQESIIKLQEADDLFMSYPAEIRERFDNSYVKFVEFLEDPDNLDEAIALKIVDKPVEPVVDAVGVLPDGTPTTPEA